MPKIPHNEKITINTPEAILLYKAVVISENPKIQGDKTIQMPNSNFIHPAFLRIYFNPIRVIVPSNVLNFQGKFTMILLRSIPSK